MIVDIKPQDPSKLVLFANKGEAAVFWLSLAGLIFLTMLTVFRYFNYQRADRNLLAFETRQNQIFTQLEQIERQELTFAVQIDTLSLLMKTTQRELQFVETRLESLKSQVKFSREFFLRIPEVLKTPAKPKQRSRKILQEFQIQPGQP